MEKIIPVFAFVSLLFIASCSKSTTSGTGANQWTENGYTFIVNSTNRGSGGITFYGYPVDNIAGGGSPNFVCNTLPTVNGSYPINGGSNSSYLILENRFFCKAGTAINAAVTINNGKLSLSVTTPVWMFTLPSGTDSMLFSGSVSEL